MRSSTDSSEKKRKKKREVRLSCTEFPPLPDRTCRVCLSFSPDTKTHHNNPPTHRRR
ncbi:hypothetical protein PISMIDRAFT_224991 [Pisolithus microcarpus 441]|uniref:Uncharacterized protein n=1 Tax=Pisolithus microcarpus 441 TaxID=765257 RepID=A0A0C9XYF8_9AGAM|nr:hypothetical protein PISMIDRAFT_224991 [Pisolithus microcarpus 441]